MIPFENLRNNADRAPSVSINNTCKARTNAYRLLHMEDTTRKKDEFTLYDLRVEVIKSPTNICTHKVGDYFTVHGEAILFPPGQTFCMYGLSAILPLLPAKQRESDENDWMSTDTDVNCPDVFCGAVYRITRTKKCVFRHSDVSGGPL